MSKAIFMMGLPAAGKSTFARKHYPDLAILDCDAIKESHPDYDPKNPGALHAWSKQKLAVQFAEALLAGKDFVHDGTGTSVENLIAKMRAAQGAGFSADLVYVTVPMSVSLRRNAARPRVVPECVIREKAEQVATAFELVSREADSVQVFDNSGEAQ